MKNSNLAIETTNLSISWGEKKVLNKINLKLNEGEKIELYASIYRYALIIPAVSVLGVFLAMAMSHYQTVAALANGDSMKNESEALTRTEVNWTILICSLIFVILV